MNAQPTKHSKGFDNSNMVPQYQRPVLGQADMNSNGPRVPHRINNDSFIPPADDLDSRNEIFNKSGTESFKDRKPLSGLQMQMSINKNQPVMASKSKNMHTKINRGISPNQPPQGNKMRNYGEENKRSYHASGIGKTSVKESNDSSRRSSSLKVKKEKDKMSYNKPSPSTRASHRGGGSFVVPGSGGSTKPENHRKPNKLSSSTQSIKPSYTKNPALGVHAPPMNNSTSSSNYKFGSGYQNRTPGSNSFGANTRIRKPTTNNGTNAHNTMASFRSGPVKVVGESNNQQPAAPSHTSNHVKKDASKRPSSASKAQKGKTSKIVTKSSNRPGTASTRTSSNRPPSPGNRSLKSDLLFGSYKQKSYKEASKPNGSGKPKLNPKSSSSSGSSRTKAQGPKRTKPHSPGRVMYSKPSQNTGASSSGPSYANYKGLRAPPKDSNDDQ